MIKIRVASANELENIIHWWFEYVAPNKTKTTQLDCIPYQSTFATHTNTPSGQIEESINVCELYIFSTI